MIKFRNSSFKYIIIRRAVKWNFILLNYAFYSPLNAILNDIDYIKSLAYLLYGSFNSTLQNMPLIIKDSNE
jgi:hypothetical protein